MLCDPGTFVEYDMFMEHTCRDFGMDKVTLFSASLVVLNHWSGDYKFSSINQSCQHLKFKSWIIQYYKQVPLISRTFENIVLDCSGPNIFY